MADDHINHDIINLCYKKFKSGYQIVCPSRFINGISLEGASLTKKILVITANYCLNINNCLFAIIFQPIFSYASGYFKGHSTASCISFLILSKPPISAQSTSGVSM